MSEPPLVGVYENDVAPEPSVAASAVAATVFAPATDAVSTSPALPEPLAVTSTCTSPWPTWTPVPVADDRERAEAGLDRAHVADRSPSVPIAGERGRRWKSVGLVNSGSSAMFPFDADDPGRAPCR